MSELCVFKDDFIPVYNLFGKLVFLVVYIFYGFSVGLGFHQPAKLVVGVVFVKNLAALVCYAAKAFAVIVVGIFCERFSLKLFDKPPEMVVFKLGNCPVL